jgi:hypothetical protein
MTCMPLPHARRPHSVIVLDIHSATTATIDGSELVRT